MNININKNKEYKYDRFLCCHLPCFSYILTLATETWSIKKVANFFNVTEYAACKARSLVQEKRNLGFTWQKREKTSQDTINLVKAVYEDDEFSQQMPGEKDYVSVSHNTHKQKQLILSNLNELCANLLMC